MFSFRSFAAHRLVGWFDSLEQRKPSNEPLCWFRRRGTASTPLVKVFHVDSSPVISRWNIVKQKFGLNNWSVFLSSAAVAADQQEHNLISQLRVDFLDESTHKAPSRLFYQLLDESSSSYWQKSMFSLPSSTLFSLLSIAFLSALSLCCLSFAYKHIHRHSHSYTNMKKRKNRQSKELHRQICQRRQNSSNNQIGRRHWRQPRQLIVFIFWTCFNKIEPS